MNKHIEKLKELPADDAALLLADLAARVADLEQSAKPQGNNPWEVDQQRVISKIGPQRFIALVDEVRKRGIDKELSGYASPYSRAYEIIYGKPL